jgi:hypothetical protein
VVVNWASCKLGQPAHSHAHTHTHARARARAGCYLIANNSQEITPVWWLQNYYTRLLHHNLHLYYTFLKLHSLMAAFQKNTISLSRKISRYGLFNVRIISTDVQKGRKTFVCIGASRRNFPEGYRTPLTF